MSRSGLTLKGTSPGTVSRPPPPKVSVAFRPGSSAQAIDACAAKRTSNGGGIRMPDALSSSTPVGENRLPRVKCPFRRLPLSRNWSPASLSP